MKKITTIIYLTALVLFTTKTNAQVSLSSDDIYSKGTYQMTTDTSHGFDVGTPGSGKTWDFSKLKSHLPNEVVVAPFSDASIDANLVEIEDGDTSMHLKKTNTTLHMLMDSDGSGNYQKLRLFNFPLNYNSSNSDSLKSIMYFSGDDFEMPLLDSIRMTSTIASTAKADAWGTVKLPMGNFDALRIKNVFKYSFAAEGKIGSFPYTKIPGFEESGSSIVYLWYSKSKGYYLANYDEEYDEMSYMVSGLLSVKNEEPKGIKEVIISNPIMNEIKLNNTGHSSYLVTLIDLNGKQIFSQKIDRNSTELIDAGNLNSGIYTVQLLNMETKTLTYQKLIK